jgi:Co/Zn/Cd efflux system component
VSHAVLHKDDHGAVPNRAMYTRLWASGVVNEVITLAEFLGGLFAGSLVLLSDRARNLSDVMAVLLALLARRAVAAPC